MMKQKKKTNKKKRYNKKTDSVKSQTRSESSKQENKEVTTAESKTSTSQIGTLQSTESGIEQKATGSFPDNTTEILEMNENTTEAVQNVLDKLLSSMVEGEDLVDCGVPVRQNSTPKENDEYDQNRNKDSFHKYPKTKTSNTESTKWSKSKESPPVKALDLVVKVKTETRSVQTEEPKKTGTEAEWSKRNDMISLEKIASSAIFESKFSSFLLAINPENRLAAGSQIDCIEETGIRAVFDKFEEYGVKGVWPFDQTDFTMNDCETKEILRRLLEEVKFCLFIECMKRGYTYMIMRKKRVISRDWLSKINSLDELNFFKSLFSVIKKHCVKFNIELKSFEYGKELSKIFDEIMPALALLNSETLAMNGISDELSSIKERVRLGFTVSQEDVDEMLESSLQEKGFGDFPCTADYCVDKFTTVSQLKLIFSKIESMFSITDIRVRFSAIKAITNIFQTITEEDKMKVFDELGGAAKLDMNKLLSMEVQEYSVTNDSVVRSRIKYMKMFFTALSISDMKEDTVVETDDLAAVLMSLYLIFETEHVNHVIFKILSTRTRREKLVDEESSHFNYAQLLDADRMLFVNALLKLPMSLRNRIQIGPEFMYGEDNEENEESMYHQVKQCLRTSRDEKECTKKLNSFMSVSPKSDFISAGRVFRIFMNFIENGQCQRNAADAILLLTDRRIQEMYIPMNLIEDLIFLALKKYSVPNEKSVEMKYTFITSVMESCYQICQKKQWKVEGKNVLPKWKSLNHPWFSELALSQWFSVLKFPDLEIQYPWDMPKVWEDENQVENETESPEKYAQLARVSTAWPNCHNLEFIAYAVRDILPDGISRFELFQEMRKYVDKLDISTTWKNNLRCAYDDLLEKVANPEQRTELPDEMNMFENVSSFDEPDVENVDNTELPPDDNTLLGAQDPIHQQGSVAAVKSKESLEMDTKTDTVLIPNSVELHSQNDKEITSVISQTPEVSNSLPNAHDVLHETEQNTQESIQKEKPDDIVDTENVQDTAKTEIVKISQAENSELLPGEVKHEESKENLDGMNKSDLATEKYPIPGKVSSSTDTLGGVSRFDYWKGSPNVPREIWSQFSSEEKSQIRKYRAENGIKKRL